MNAIEIEVEVCKLVESPFDAATFAFAFLEAYGSKSATIKKLQSSVKTSTNKSDVEGGVLQRSNIHILACAPGTVNDALQRLRDSAATTKHKCKYVLATDGEQLGAEYLIEGEILQCDFTDLPNSFGFFLTLAGISTTKAIRENPFDIRATSRLNKLYVEILKVNPSWTKPERQEDLNHFMAQLIFCFFAEDTRIFEGEGLFTDTVQTMSAADSSNTHEVLSEIFRAMSLSVKQRAASGNTPRWANKFPHVNGGLFGDRLEVPAFSKIARSYLREIGNLDWKHVNPDIFGSMIQAVADPDERAELGMHYTSVPNILKVLNPLFLDELREQLEAAGESTRKLLNLRKRMAHIRVFDPACGSGNFLVIAYKEMRKIEATINELRGEKYRKSEIHLTNFRGIELKHFSAEIARLALVIAEYQADELYRGQDLALAEFLPLSKDNWIRQGNALRMDWLKVCPPFGKTDGGAKTYEDDLFQTPLDQPEMTFANEGGEVFICGNPPYVGSTWQSKDQKSDLKLVFAGRAKSWKSLDYIAGWFMKAVDYKPKASAFVATNSICQGQQVSILWPLIFESNHRIHFAYTSFKWVNLASLNAGVTVAIIGLTRSRIEIAKIFANTGAKKEQLVEVDNINAYLVAGVRVEVGKISIPLNGLNEMSFGNKPVDGGHLLLTRSERDALALPKKAEQKFTKRIYGSSEFIRGGLRYCLWITDEFVEEALEFQAIEARVENVKKVRLESRDKGANKMAEVPHQFREMNTANNATIIIPSVSSESREYLPVGYIPAGDVVSNLAFALYDGPLWNLSFIASTLHLTWIATVCGKLKTDYRYSNTLGWNTFPVPTLTEKNKADLTESAKNILLARERYWPATIAEMYDPKRMDKEFPEVRAAHEHNDLVLERIYIGRRFKNDTERLEKLFAMYVEMTEKEKK
ncbi:MAG: class I SAM-dependent DNA methyltransferase [Saprospiraceae bacterium]